MIEMLFPFTLGWMIIGYVVTAGELWCRHKMFKKTIKNYTELHPPMVIREMIIGTAAGPWALIALITVMCYSLCVVKNKGSNE